MKINYLRRRHSASALFAHLVFTVKYRRRVITPRVFEVIRRSMRRTAQSLGIEIITIEADGDHLHLMIFHPPRLALSEIVRRLKGAASRHVRQQRFSEVLKRLWGKSFWSPSYFVVSCGGAPLEVIKTYVENQGKSEKPQRTRATAKSAKENSAFYPRAEARGLRMRV